jgi:hypothetical protein
MSVISLTRPALSQDWATSAGSCYEQRSLTVSFGGSLFWGYGPFVGVDYAFHHVISGGGAVALLWGLYGDYLWLPVMARAAFHPFNLSVLADKIPVRDKVDVYAGFAVGWKFIDDPWPRFREYLGARYFFTPNFFGVLEEGSGLGNINIGVGFKF